MQATGKRKKDEQVGQDLRIGLMRVIDRCGGNGKIVCTFNSEGTRSGTGNTRTGNTREKRERGTSSDAVGQTLLCRSLKTGKSIMIEVRFGANRGYWKAPNNYHELEKVVPLLLDRHWLFIDQGRYSLVAGAALVLHCNPHMPYGHLPNNSNRNRVTFSGQLLRPSTPLSGEGGILCSESIGAAILKMIDGGK